MPRVWGSGAAAATADGVAPLLTGDSISLAVSRGRVQPVEAPAAVQQGVVPLGDVVHDPRTVSQRYARLVARLGTDITLRKLRRDNATELIAAGAGIRTVAGRLGHGGYDNPRGLCTLVDEADQRAALAVAARLPQRPTRQARSQ